MSTEDEVAQELEFIDGALNQVRETVLSRVREGLPFRLTLKTNASEYTLERTRGEKLEAPK